MKPLGPNILSRINFYCVKIILNLHYSMNTKKNPVQNLYIESFSLLSISFSCTTVKISNYLCTHIVWDKNLYCHDHPVPFFLFYLLILIMYLLMCMKKLLSLSLFIIIIINYNILLYILMSLSFITVFLLLLYIWQFCTWYCLHFHQRCQTNVDNILPYLIVVRSHHQNNIDLQKETKGNQRKGWSFFSLTCCSMLDTI